MLFSAAAIPVAGCVVVNAFPFPSGITDADAAGLYLRPLCGPRGGQRLAGGWAHFDLVEIILKRGGAVERVSVPAAGIMDWAAKTGGAVEQRVAALYGRITAARSPFAGVAMDAPQIMGVLNVTPDSFSDGGDFATAPAAIERGRALVDAGAAILDIGGESTRPGSEPVMADEEIRRTLPVFSALNDADMGAVLSVDSRKAPVMEAALGAGAKIINDISALDGDTDSLDLAARHDCHVVLMHCQGEPKTMQQAPAYEHPALEIFDYLENRIKACEGAGIDRSRIAVDPGIGFGKALEHNLDIMASLSMFHGLGCPVLIGVSRKSFIGNITGEEKPKARLPGSLAAMLASLAQGAQMLRVHDVAETTQAVAVWQAIGTHGPDLA